MEKTPKLTESTRTISDELGSLEALGLTLDPSVSEGVRTNLELLHEHYAIICQVSAEDEHAS